MAIDQHNMETPFGDGATCEMFHATSQKREHISAPEDFYFAIRVGCHFHACYSVHYVAYNLRVVVVAGYLFYYICLFFPTFVVLQNGNRRMAVEL